jgi:hypothetical protein
VLGIQSALLLFLHAALDDFLYTISELNSHMSAFKIFSLHQRFPHAVPDDFLYTIPEHNTQLNALKIFSLKLR